MRLIDSCRQALWGVFTRRLASAAIVLSLATGVAAIVLVGAVLSGFSAELERLTFGAYARAVIVRPNFFVGDQYRSPNRADGDYLKARMARIVQIVLWRAETAQSMKDGRTVNYTLFGVEGPYETEVDTPVAVGRPLTAREAASGERLCLLGAYLAQDLAITAAGGEVRVNGIGCRVIGILAEPASRPAHRYGSAMIAPLGAAERFYFRAEDRRRGEVDTMTLLLQPGADRARAEAEVDQLLRARLGVSFRRPSPFAYDDALAPLKQVADQQRLLRQLLVLLAAVASLSATVAFAAIAAAGVDSRRREIAIRMASGAARRDVVHQLLVEIGLLSATGSLLGLALGLGGGLMAALAWNWPFRVGADMVVAGCLFGVVAGVLVGAVLTHRIAGGAPSLIARGVKSGR